MDEDILLTIIVPVYNVKKYLMRCVESIRNQTYRNLEIILVDDGSTDGSGALCDSFAARDGRIRVLHQQNGGSSSARNAGLRAARGRYIGFVDSDDYIMPQMYELLLEALRQSGLQVAQASRKEIAESGEELPPICVPPEKVTRYPAEVFLRELLLHRGDCSFCTKLCDSGLFESRLFPVGVLNEDFALLVNMLQDMEGIVSIPEQTYCTYYRTGSNTRKASRDEFSRVYGDCVNNADMVNDLVKTRYPGLAEEAVRFGLFQRLEYLLHIPIAQMTRDNEQYADIVSYVRANRRNIIRNHYLTAKNKLYLLLFSAAPRNLRRLHRASMRLRGIRG